MCLIMMIFGLELNWFGLVLLSFWRLLDIGHFYLPCILHDSQSLSYMFLNILQLFLHAYQLEIVSLFRRCFRLCLLNCSFLQGFCHPLITFACIFWLFTCTYFDPTKVYVFFFLCCHTYTHRHRCFLSTFYPLGFLPTAHPSIVPELCLIQLPF